MDPPGNVFCNQHLFVPHRLRTDIVKHVTKMRRFLINFKDRSKLCLKVQVVVSANSSQPDSNIGKLYQDPDEIHDCKQPRVFPSHHTSV
jgi:hypothetical protein